MKQEARAGTGRMRRASHEVRAWGQKGPLLIRPGQSRVSLLDRVPAEAWPTRPGTN
jgi:hypothetical protein